MRLTDREARFIQGMIEAYHSDRGSFPDDDSFYENAASVASKLSFGYDDGWLDGRLREIEERKADG